MNLRRIVAVAGVLTVVGAAGAGAATTRSISIVDFAFQPAASAAAQGDSVRWTNKGASQHSVVSDTGLYSSQVLSNGGMFRSLLRGAGSYHYHCGIHQFMTGSVKVPVKAPATGTVGRAFTVTFASGPAPSGQQYVVQVRMPGAAVFKTLKATSTAGSSRFTPRKAGSYAFRAQTHKVGSALANTAWSALRSVSVH